MSNLNSVLLSSLSAEPIQTCSSKNKMCSSKKKKNYVVPIKEKNNVVTLIIMKM